MRAVFIFAGVAAATLVALGFMANNAAVEPARASLPSPPEPRAPASEWVVRMIRLPPPPPTQPPTQAPKPVVQKVAEKVAQKPPAAPKAVPTAPPKASAPAPAPASAPASTPRTVAPVVQSDAPEKSRAAPVSGSPPGPAKRLASAPALPRPITKPRPAAPPAVVRATADIVATGRRLEALGSMPEVALLAPDEDSYLAFYEAMGARVFVECGGRLERMVVRGTRATLTAPATAGLDLRRPRALQGGARAGAVLQSAGRSVGACGVVLLLPVAAEARMRHAVFGALATVGGRASLSAVRQVEGVYHISAGGASIRLTAGRDAGGGAVPLALDIRL